MGWKKWLARLNQFLQRIRGGNRGYDYASRGDGHPERGFVSKPRDPHSSAEDRLRMNGCICKPDFRECGVPRPDSRSLKHTSPNNDTEPLHELPENDTELSSGNADARVNTTAHGEIPLDDVPRGIGDGGFRLVAASFAPLPKTHQVGNNQPLMPIGLPPNRSATKPVDPIEPAGSPGGSVLNLPEIETKSDPEEKNFEGRESKILGPSSHQPLPNNIRVENSTVLPPSETFKYAVDKSFELLE